MFVSEIKLADAQLLLNKEILVYQFYMVLGDS